MSIILWKENKSKMVIKLNKIIKQSNSVANVILWYIIWMSYYYSNMNYEGFNVNQCSYLKLWESKNIHFFTLEYSVLCFRKSLVSGYKLFRLDSFNIQLLTLTSIDELLFSCKRLEVVILVTLLSENDLKANFQGPKIGSRIYYKFITSSQLIVWVIIPLLQSYSKVIIA